MKLNQVKYIFVFFLLFIFFNNQAFKGRTSSVGNDILGFDSKGNIVNDKDTHGAKSLDWEAICKNSSKVITFIDLAGHEKYLKTTVFGMTGHVNIKKN